MRSFTNEAFALHSNMCLYYKNSSRVSSLKCESPGF